MADEKVREKSKKQIPLRVSASLYAEIAQWAEEDFRSINGQIEYLLTECVKHRKKNYRNCVKNMTGFLSFSIHISQDGKRSFF